MTFDNFRIVRDRPGVMTVVFDMPGRPVNVVDESLLRELTALVSEIERDAALRMVVFRSGKESGFLAGADVRHIERIAHPEQAEVVLRAGQELFDRIAALPLMTVAVIHGPCLGGGLEFALACTHRIARDDTSTRLGLPETQLGVIPGWGGTQRLPQLVGASSALRMILEGQRLSATKAAKIGLIDQSIPAERFDALTQKFLTDCLAGKPPRRRKRRGLARFLDDTRPGRWLVLRTARRQIASKVRHYPALPAAVRAIETGLRSGHERGLAVEREEFERVLFTPACRNLLSLFFDRERSRKPSTWTEPGVTPRPIRTVAVIGAGTMGAGIAQLAALNGCDVILKDIRIELVGAGRARIESLMKDAVRAGAATQDEANRAMDRIVGAIDWNDVASADLAIEAVVERMDVKQEVFRELDARLPAESIIVSNTSALPIGPMAAATSRAGRVAGLHFFNPVHRMALVEVVRTRGTSDETAATLVEFVRALGKAPIVVSESPGFLVNRILFPYLDEGVRLVSEGRAADAVDREARRFGMPMGPLELLDQVGIDVAADVSRTLVTMNTEASPTPRVLGEMVSAGRLGKKSDKGFYEYRSGRAIRAARMESPKSATNDGHAAEPMLGGERWSEITQRLVLPMINTAAECLAERVVAEPWMVDLGMVLGTGFAPFRGGPLKLADAWGVREVVEAMDRLAERHGPRFKPCGLLRDLAREGQNLADHRDVRMPDEAVSAAVP